MSLSAGTCFLKSKSNTELQPCIKARTRSSEDLELWQHPRPRRCTRLRGWTHQHVESSTVAKCNSGLGRNEPTHQGHRGHQTPTGGLREDKGSNDDVELK